MSNDFQKFYTLPEWVFCEWDGTGNPAQSDKPRWSGKLPPPVIGETIRIKINGIGLATVEGYCVTCNFLGVMARPLNPPDWYVKQNNGNVTSAVFGAEIKEI